MSRSRPHVATVALACGLVAALAVGALPLAGAAVAAVPQRGVPAGTVLSGAVLSGTAPTSVSPDGGLPGGNASLELFNALVRSVRPPEQSVDSATPGATDDLGGKGDAAKAISDLAGTGFGVAGFISGMVFGLGSDKDLKEILNDLQQIQNTLNTMESQLVAIQASIAQLTAIVEQQFKDTDCLVTLSNLNTYVAAIQTAKQDYGVLSSMGATMFANPNADGTPNTALGPTTPQLLAFTAHADALQSALNGISDVLLGGYGSGAALSTCANAAASQASAPLEWEDQYYSALYALVEKEYQIQVTGLDMLLAAYYTQAWLAAYPDAVNQPAGSTVPVTPVLPQQLAYICFDPAVRTPHSAVDEACTQASGAVAGVYGNIEAQLLYAGVPYSWGSDGQVAMLTTFANGVPKAQALWVLDLNDFQALQPDGVTPCPYPLATSTGNVCGGTVGTTGPFSNPTALNYTGWRPARTVDWLLLLGTSSGVNQTPLGTLMQQKGLAVPGDYVIYTGEASDLTGGPSLWTQAWKDAHNQTKTTYGYVNGMCLLETGLPAAQSTWTYQPLCDQQGGGTLAYLMNAPVRSTKWSYGGLQFGWNPDIPGTNPLTGDYDPWRMSFYALGSIFTSTDSGHIGKSGGQYVNASTVSGAPAVYGPPGWGSGWNYGPNQPGQQLAFPTPTFRWPVISASSIDCSWRGALLSSLGHAPTNPATNEAGMPTMCGDDLDAWLAQVMPGNPPTAVQQVGPVPDAPTRIRPAGVTRLLGPAAQATLSGQPLRVSVAAATTRRALTAGPGAGAASMRPDGRRWREKRHFWILRKASGAVSIRPKGHRGLRFTVTYTAPSVRYFRRYTATYTYRVR